MKRLAERLKSLGWCVIHGEFTQIVQGGEPIKQEVIDKLPLKIVVDSGKFNITKRRKHK